MLSWSGLRDFLEVAETGSLSAAAKNLKVSQPTLGRRIQALEDELKSELFVRTPQGLTLTETGEHILGYSKRMQDEAFAVERVVTGRDKGLSGVVIISIVEGMATHWLINELDEFYQQYPDITLVIQAEQEAADLLRREADIAVRLFEPTQMDLISKKGGTVRLGLYASKGYLKKHGRPKCVADLKDHNFLMHSNDASGDKDVIMEDLAKHFKRTTMISSNMTVILSGLSNGLGMGVHANIVAKQDANLVNLFPDEINTTLDFWLVTHSELRRSARIRAVYNFLSQLTEKHRDKF